MDEVTGDGSAELRDDGLDRDHIRLPQWRRGYRHQRQIGSLFNTLLESLFDPRSARWGRISSGAGWQFKLLGGSLSC